MLLEQEVVVNLLPCGRIVNESVDKPVAIGFCRKKRKTHDKNA